MCRYSSARSPVSICPVGLTKIEHQRLDDIASCTPKVATEVVQHYECVVGILVSLYQRPAACVEPAQCPMILDCTGDSTFAVVYAALRCGFTCTVAHFSVGEVDTGLKNGEYNLPGSSHQHTLHALKQKLEKWVAGQAASVVAIDESSGASESEEEQGGGADDSDDQEEVETGHV